MQITVGNNSFSEAEKLRKIRGLFRDPRVKMTSSCFEESFYLVASKELKLLMDLFLKNKNRYTPNGLGFIYFSLAHALNTGNTYLFKSIISWMEIHHLTINNLIFNGELMLHHAIKMKNKEIALFLINKGDSIELKGRLGFDALSLAIDIHHMEIVPILIRIKKASQSQCAVVIDAEVHLTEEDFLRYFELFSLSRHMMNFLLLLPNTPFSLEFGYKVLCHAIKIDQLPIVRYLIENRKVDQNAKPAGEKFSPVYYAAENSKSERYFFKSNLDDLVLDATWDEQDLEMIYFIGQSFFHTASDCHHVSILYNLIARKRAHALKELELANRSLTVYQAEQAIRLLPSMEEERRILVAANELVNLSNEIKRFFGDWLVKQPFFLTLIKHNQTKKNYFILAFLSTLIRKKSISELMTPEEIQLMEKNLYLIGKNGKSLLHLAVEKEDEPMVLRLIENKALVNLQDTAGTGFTALHIAIMRKNVGITALLLNAGARKDILCNTGHSPLDLVKQSADKYLMNLLYLNPLDATPQISNHRSTFISNLPPVAQGAPSWALSGMRQ